MWLHDPYVVDQWLRRHAEIVARAGLPRARTQANPAARSPLAERVTLALRVLADGALAARVRASEVTPAAAPALPSGAPPPCA